MFAHLPIVLLCPQRHHFPWQNSHVKNNKLVRRLNANPKGQTVVRIFPIVTIFIVKTVFNCSTSTFRPQAFFKKTKLNLLSHCCHCLFNFPQMFLILFYDAHIVHFWRIPVASLYAVVDGFAVRCCDVMARTSCATVRSTI